MKIILLANHAAILPVANYFHSKKWLKAIISPQKSHQNHLQIALFCQNLDIPFYLTDAKELKTTLVERFHQINPDLAFVCGFPFKLPRQLFSIPKLGFFNIHFSLLPSYGGPDPIFWQLRNGEQTGGITLHKVDDEFDSGEVVMRQELPFLQDENWGICNSRYSVTMLNMLVAFTEALNQHNIINPVQPIGISESYFPKPVTADLIINWDIQTADEIQNLVNACNPSAGGAITFFRQQQVRIIEVSQVDSYGQEGIPAGTIVGIDGNGLLVQCLNRVILKINIVQLFEGIVSGFKLAITGMKTGDSFETSFLKQKI